MANLFTDNFTRANAANLGSNWDADDSGNNIDWDLDTNTAENQLPTGTNGQWIRTTSSAHTATADVKVSVTTVGSGHDGGPFARCTSVAAGAREAYVVYASSGGISIVRNNSSGAETQLGSTQSITAAAGKVIAIEVSGTGGTVTIKSYYDGVLKDTQTDTSASRLTAAGRTGMTNWASLGTNSRYDDFTVDSLGGAAYTLTADAGSYAWTGSATGLKAQRKITAASGSYNWTGTAVGLRAARKLVVAAGSYAWTGTDTALRRGYKLVASAGSYVWTGTNAALRATRKLVAAAGSYVWTGSSATLTYAQPLVPVVILTGDVVSAPTVADSVAVVPTLVGAVVVEPTLNLTVEIA